MNDVIVGIILMVWHNYKKNICCIEGIVINIFQSINLFEYKIELTLLILQ